MTLNGKPPQWGGGLATTNVLMSVIFIGCSLRLEELQYFIFVKLTTDGGVLAP